MLTTFRGHRSTPVLLALLGLVLLLVQTPLRAAVAVVVATSKGAVGSGAGITTDPIDSSTGTLAVACVASGSDTIDTSDLSDSEGHTWSALAEYNSGADAGKIRMFYATLNSTDAAHTFTLTHLDDASIAVIILSGTGASPADNESGYTGGAGGTTVQPGNMTPSQDDTMPISCVAWTTVRTIAINSGFTIATQQASAGAGDLGIGLAWKSQTTATLENPTWTFNVFYYQAANMAAFRQSGGGAGAGDRPCCLGVF